VRFGLGVVDAETDDALWRDPDQRVALGVLGLLGSAADLQTAHPPRVVRHDVVDHERDGVVDGHIAKLLTLRQVVAVHVDSAQLLVVAEPHRAVLQRAVAKARTSTSVDVNGRRRH
jgi:hypothetical protein